MEMIAVSAESLAYFWNKVDKTGECWQWQGSINNHGYGRLWISGKTFAAHRFSYELANGRIPAGLVIDHVCHVRHCVNPAHLRTVTMKQNNENPAGRYVSNKSGVHGVHWSNHRRKWVGVVRHNNEVFNVGGFHNLPDAEAAVIAKRLELFTHNELDRKAVS